ncbi:hypothetical protein E2C01_067846 [Portunus trituberculatus]|uniref:Uncharacterized protein n=1 Tax=Portunus trituberculatus TaxID=210409 RepID=A0A5B7HYI0_PORTR|nr:hypothetical protein [Portunus trituberculatus]
MTGLLFGDDLSQATRKIEEAERLKSKFTCKKPSRFWTSSSDRFGGGKQQNFFAKAPSRGFSSRYQPYRFHRTPSSSEPRCSYLGQAWTAKNLRGRSQHNPQH